MTCPPVRWLGRLDYRDAHSRQIAHRDSIVNNTASEQIWCLEHPPVITTGRRTAERLPDLATQDALGVPVVATERGGLATWHGPGQLIVWPLIHIVRRRIGVRQFVELLEDAVISWLSTIGVHAGRRAGTPGVWCDHPLAPHARKICAVGLHIHRGVTAHGLALNLSPDMAGYQLIIPCGIRGAGITSVAQLNGNSPSVEAAAASLGEVLADHIAAASADSGEKSLARPSAKP